MGTVDHYGRPWPMKTFYLYLKKTGMDGIVKKPDAQAEIPSSGLTTGNLSKHCQFRCLLLASSIKNHPLSTPQGVTDKLHSTTFKWLAALLVEPMTNLFNNSHATACVPNGWKAAIIIF